MLLTGLGDEFVVLYLPYFRQRLIICLLSALLPFQPLFTESFHGDQLLASPLFSGVLSELLPPAVCSFFIFLFIVLVFLGGVGSVCTGSYACLSQGWLREYHIMLGAHLFGMPNVFQAGLKLASASTGALLFLSVMWHGELSTG
jgi:hypothetical protein